MGISVTMQAGRQGSCRTDQHSEINKVNYGSKWIIKYYQGVHQSGASATKIIYLLLHLAMARHRQSTVNIVPYQGKTFKVLTVDLFHSPRRLYLLSGWKLFVRFYAEKEQSS